MTNKDFELFLTSGVPSSELKKMAEAVFDPDKQQSTPNLLQKSVNKPAPTFKPVPTAQLPKMDTKTENTFTPGGGFTPPPKASAPEPKIDYGSTFNWDQQSRPEALQAAITSLGTENARIKKVQDTTLKQFGGSPGLTNRYAPKQLRISGIVQNPETGEARYSVQGPSAADVGDAASQGVEQYHDDRFKERFSNFAGTAGKQRTVNGKLESAKQYRKRVLNQLETGETAGRVTGMVGDAANLIGSSMVGGAGTLAMLGRAAPYLAKIPMLQRAAGVAGSFAPVVARDIAEKKVDKDYGWNIATAPLAGGIGTGVGNAVSKIIKSPGLQKAVEPVLRRFTSAGVLGGSAALRDGDALDIANAAIMGGAIAGPHGKSAPAADLRVGPGARNLYAGRLKGGVEPALKSTVAETPVAKPETGGGTTLAATPADAIRSNRQATVLAEGTTAASTKLNTRKAQQSLQALSAQPNPDGVFPTKGDVSVLLPEFNQQMRKQVFNKQQRIQEFMGQQGKPDAPTIETLAKDLGLTKKQTQMVVDRIGKTAPPAAVEPPPVGAALVDATRGAVGDAVAKVPEATRQFAGKAKESLRNFAGASQDALLKAQMGIQDIGAAGLNKLQGMGSRVVRQLRGQNPPRALAQQQMERGSQPIVRAEADGTLIGRNEKGSYSPVYKTVEPQQSTPRWTPEQRAARITAALERLKTRGPAEDVADLPVDPARVRVAPDMGGPVIKQTKAEVLQEVQGRDYENYVNALETLKTAPKGSKVQATAKKLVQDLQMQYPGIATKAPLYTQAKARGEAGVEPTRIDVSGPRGSMEQVTAEQAKTAPQQSAPAAEARAPGAAGAGTPESWKDLPVGSIEYMGGDYSGNAFYLRTKTGIQSIKASEIPPGSPIFRSREGGGYEPYTLEGAGAQASKGTGAAPAESVGTGGAPSSQAKQPSKPGFMESGDDRINRNQGPAAESGSRGYVKNPDGTYTELINRDGGVYTGATTKEIPKGGQLIESGESAGAGASAQGTSTPVETREQYKAKIQGDISNYGSAKARLKEDTAFRRGGGGERPWEETYKDQELVRRVESNWGGKSGVKKLNDMGISGIPAELRDATTLGKVRGFIKEHPKASFAASIAIPGLIAANDAARNAITDAGASAIRGGADLWNKYTHLGSGGAGSGSPGVAAGTPDLNKAPRNDTIDEKGITDELSAGATDAQKKELEKLPLDEKLRIYLNEKRLMGKTLLDEGLRNLPKVDRLQDQIDRGNAATADGATTPIAPTTIADLRAQAQDRANKFYGIQGYTFGGVSGAERKAFIDRRLADLERSGLTGDALVNDRRFQYLMGLDKQDRDRANVLNIAAQLRANPNNPTLRAQLAAARKTYNAGLKPGGRAKSVVTPPPQPEQPQQQLREQPITPEQTAFSNASMDNFLYGRATQANPNAGGSWEALMPGRTSSQQQKEDAAVYAQQYVQTPYTMNPGDVESSNQLLNTRRKNPVPMSSVNVLEAQQSGGVPVQTASGATGQLAIGQAATPGATATYTPGETPTIVDSQGAYRTMINGRPARIQRAPALNNNDLV